MAQDMDIPFLGSIPLDPRIGMACDYGQSFLEEYPESPASEAYRGIIARLQEGLTRAKKA